MGLDTRADSLLVGCLLGLLATWGLLPRSQRFVYWTGLGALISAAGLGFLAWKLCLDHSQYYHGLFTVAAVMVAVIIARLLVAPSRWGSLLLGSAPLVGAGRISYGLYLYHIPVIALLRPAELGPLTMALAAAGLTLAAALLSFYCIERPCLRLKDRLGRTTPEEPRSLTIRTIAAVPPQKAA
jgi:peptidoglycan/LPS O-acetylase OafA/YrhL